jgi:hypothetical protein
VIQEIDWEAVRAHPRLPAELSPLVPERIAGLPLPVLLPPRDPWLTKAKFTSGPRWYAATVRLDGHHVYLSGNGVVKRVADQAPRPMPDLRVVPAEGTMSATWQQFGVTYLVNVECEDPEGDPRCTEQQYVRGLVESLVVAGGAP